jgi:hypothetical protein
VVGVPRLVEVLNVPVLVEHAVDVQVARHRVQQPVGARLGPGRIAASETEAPNLLANLV